MRRLATFSDNYVGAPSSGQGWRDGVRSAKGVPCLVSGLLDATRPRAGGPGLPGPALLRGAWCCGRGRGRHLEPPPHRCINCITFVRISGHGSPMPPLSAASGQSTARPLSPLLQRPRNSRRLPGRCQVRTPGSRAGAAHRTASHSHRCKAGEPREGCRPREKVPAARVPLASGRRATSHCQVG